MCKVGKIILKVFAILAAIAGVVAAVYYWNLDQKLLDWFYKNQRSLPFRTDPSPYHVWLSEIMLQQTRVSAALPYYERFLAALPDIPALAACEEEKLHKLWEGLGYYSRVRNLQKAARIVCEQYGGDLPADYDALRSLPGIGDYTAGAVASIAFGIPVPAVDGNVLRVFARLYNDDADVMAPATKKAFTVRVLDQMPKATPGPYNEALMELGALVCVPNGAPLCDVCPLAGLCQARAAGTTAAATAAALTAQAFAHALQAGQTVAQEGQLGLQLAFVGHGTAAEDLEDEHGAVDDFEAAEGRGDVADLAAGQLTVEDGALGPQLCCGRSGFFQLAAAQHDAGLRGLALLGHLRHGLHVVGLAQGRKLCQTALTVPQALIQRQQNDLRRGCFH